MSTSLELPAVTAPDPGNALVLHSSSRRLHQPPPPTPPSSGVEFDLLDSLQRHWILALSVFGTIVTVGIIWAFMTMHPVYQAETTIFIPPELVKDDSFAGLPTPYPTFVNQQIMTILHYNTLIDAIQQLKQKGVNWKLPGESEPQAVGRLRSALDVQRVPDSYEVAIQMTSNNPASAATIVNAVAQSFLYQGNHLDASGSIDREQALLKEKETLQQELKDQLDLRAKLAASLQVVNLQKSTALPNDEVLRQTREALSTAHSRRIEAEARLAAGETTLSVDAEQIASNDPTARTLTTNLLQKQYELREKIKSMLPSHPVRKQTELELAAIDAELAKGPGENIPKVTAQLMTKLRSQADEARRVEEGLTREVARQTLTIPDMAKNLSQAEYLSANIARIQERLGRTEGQIEEMTLRTSSGSIMRVFSQAQPPTAPLKSQRMKALGMSFALATLLGLGLPLVLDLRDSAIHDPATIERALGFPIVGMTIARTPGTEEFADEHLRRLAAGIERGIAEGAKTVLLMGIKQPAPTAVIRDLSLQLAEDGINVTVTAARRKSGSQSRPLNSRTKILGPGAPATEELESFDAVLLHGPALVFWSEAERLAAEADITILVVEAGKDTQAELVRGARLLERLNIPAIGVVLQNVRVDRAGRRMRQDLKEYLAWLRRPAIATTWVS